MELKDNKYEKSALPAIRLFNPNETACAFETGQLPVQLKIDATCFFCQTKVDPYEKTAHPAPRKQYVVTLKGKLRFRVSSGDTFILEPGVILIAEDVKGPGHSWELIDGEEWIRIYIPIPEGTEHPFIADGK